MPNKQTKKNINEKTARYQDSLYQTYQYSVYRIKVKLLYKYCKRIPFNKLVVKFLSNF